MDIICPERAAAATDRVLYLESLDELPAHRYDVVFCTETVKESKDLLASIEKIALYCKKEALLHIATEFSYTSVPEVSCLIGHFSKEENRVYQLVNKPKLLPCHRPRLLPPANLQNAGAAAVRDSAPKAAAPKAAAPKTAAPKAAAPKAAALKAAAPKAAAPKAAFAPGRAAQLQHMAAVREARGTALKLTRKRPRIPRKRATSWGFVEGRFLRRKRA
jgi:hypothetical protein